MSFMRPGWRTLLAPTRGKCPVYTTQTPQTTSKHQFSNYLLEVFADAQVPPYPPQGRDNKPPDSYYCGDRFVRAV